MDKQAYLKGFITKLADDARERNTRHAGLKALGATAGIGTVSDMAYPVLANNAFKMRDPEPIHNALMNTPVGKSVGRELHPVSQIRNNPMTNNNPVTDRMLEWMQRMAFAYNAKTHALVMPELSERMPHYGVLAHELGHATQDWLKTKPGVATYTTSKLLPFASLIPILHSKDEDAARNYATGGTVASAPMMAAELQASYRGSKMLKGLPGVGRLGRLSPYIGIPSYALASVLPQIAYRTKKHFGGYTSSK